MWNCGIRTAELGFTAMEPPLIGPAFSGPPAFDRQPDNASDLPECLATGKPREARRDGRFKAGALRHLQPVETHG